MIYYSDSDEYNDITENEDLEPVMVTSNNYMDGAKNVDEMIDRLNTFIEYLTYLKDDGWELQAPIINDIGYLYK